MDVDRQYTDTHGASIFGFAFAYMLDFKLMPSLKNSGSAKVYWPAAGQNDQWPHLGPVLSTRTIDWDLIAQQYDQIVKHTTALRLGAAEAEQVPAPVHPRRPQAPDVLGDRRTWAGGAYLVRLQLPHGRRNAPGDRQRASVRWVGERPRRSDSNPQHLNPGDTSAPLEAPSRLSRPGEEPDPVGHEVSGDRKAQENDSAVDQKDSRIREEHGGSVGEFGGEQLAGEDH